MAAGHDTYISQLLESAGFRNALLPELRGYPKVKPDEVPALEVEAMLFPSEPYDSQLPRDLDAFPGRPVEQGGCWRLPDGAAAFEVDGQLLSWYPSLTAEGLRCARRLNERPLGTRGTTAANR